MTISKVYTFLVLLVAASHLSAQPTETGFLNRTVTFDGSTRNYQVYLPRDYNDAEEWPIILFLHGAGERGDDGLKQTQVGLGRAIRLNPERWPAVVVFPQAAEDTSWQGKMADSAMAALDAVIGEFSIDETRIYLTGLSLGGNGTWYLGNQHADRFAALVAVCGFIQLEGRRPSFVSDTANPYAVVARNLAAKPVWIVHGDADVVVPVAESRLMFKALEEVGAQVEYLELPGINHNSWDAAYSNERLIDWLFSKQL